MLQLLLERLAHPNVVQQLFAQVFFFVNTALFNALMDDGERS